MRKWFFKWRGALMVPLAIIILLLGKPTPASFFAGIAVALLGEALRIWGVGYAGKTTRGEEVKAPCLVTAGPFAHVRNPLYLGNAITGLGFTVMACGAAPPFVVALLMILFLLFYVTVYGTIIPLEEEFLRETFGDPYSEYCSHVPRIVPRLSPYEKKQGTFSWMPIKSGESETLVLFALFSLIMLGKVPQWGGVLLQRIFPS
ncbi:MAG: isoprenylcysteine carboxylmethyltransferase family protein [Candidatus Eremiobacteraeota bacterium]|nr:isoprenylcysteine carboxylmethyltransferase family protein [Candidatus Eremiobacteraeota bacterium]